jgi:hypothetical protein
MVNFVQVGEAPPVLRNHAMPSLAVATTTSRSPSASKSTTKRHFTSMEVWITDAVQGDPPCPTLLLYQLTDVLPPATTSQSPSPSTSAA